MLINMCKLTVTFGVSIPFLVGIKELNRTCYIQRFDSFCTNCKFITQKVIHEVVNSSHECEIMII